MKFIDDIINTLGRWIGIAETKGFWYPVKQYCEPVSGTNGKLWRGSRVDSDELQKMLSGFGCIVNLCAENDSDTAWCKALGISSVHIPVLDNTPPTKEQMDKFCNIAIDPGNSKVYVHCEAGKGRTGVAVACYRIKVQGWTAEAAIAEAKLKGMAMPDQEEFLREYCRIWNPGKLGDLK